MRVRSLIITVLGLGVTGTFAGCAGSGGSNSLANGPVRQGTSEQTAVARIKSSVSQNVKTVSDAVTPQAKVIPAQDPIGLSTKTPPIGPDLFVARARLLEAKEDFPAAARQYDQALAKDPKYMPAFIGYARLLDRQNKLDEATTYYERAVKVQPKSAIALNHLGLCYARRGILDKSHDALMQAVQLEPKKALYRNNIAAVLLDMNQRDAALNHLRAVTDPATAHYNLACLMHRRGDVAAAREGFARALELNPSMTPARTWLARLSGQSAEIARRPQPDGGADNSAPRRDIGPSHDQNRPMPRQATPSSRPPSQRIRAEEVPTATIRLPQTWDKRPAPSADAQDAPSPGAAPTRDADYADMDRFDRQ